MVDVLIGALAGLGFLNASYFTAIAYRWIQPDARWIPSFCRMGERTCSSVVFTPSARVFGPPNSLLGQLYYAALGVTLASGRLTGSVLDAFVAVAAVTVLLAAYLTYSLLVVLRVPCPLCFTAHGINVVLLGLLWAKM